MSHLPSHLVSHLGYPSHLASHLPLYDSHLPSHLVSHLGYPSHLVPHLVYTIAPGFAPPLVQFAPGFDFAPPVAPGLAPGLTVAPGSAPPLIPFAPPVAPPFIRRTSSRTWSHPSHLGYPSHLVPHLPLYHSHLLSHLPASVAPGLAPVFAPGLSVAPGFAPGFPLFTSITATVGALGVLSSQTRLYGARAMLISGSCKRETGAKHATLLNTAYQASKKTTLRTVCIASDGESRRGEALVRLTFKHVLSPESPIYPLLSPLPLMNLEVGDDDLTPDKDTKHIDKRARNLITRPKGLLVHGIHITPSIIRIHLLSNGMSTTRVDYLLNPNDKQDVKLAYDLLREIWMLPMAPTTKSPGFQDSRRAIQTLGTFFHYLLNPYICVDLSLSEQLEYLSSAAHLLMALFAEGNAGTRLMPTQLYVDTMIMIKNVYFCVAKAKVDDPNGLFFIVLLGTDRLETLFGILRTMIGNDANVDLLQLGARVTGTSEVATILAKHPEWDRAPRRLRLPALDKDGLEIHNHVDYIGPASWRGDTRVSQVNLQTSWKLGRMRVETKFPSLINILASMSGFNIFSPLGKDLVKAPRDPDDVDDTIDEDEATPTTDLPPGPDLEDAIAEADTRFDPCFELNGKKVYKSRYLSQAFEGYRRTGSTDRLKRVANVQRYAYKAQTQFGVIEHDDEAGDNTVSVDLPVATLFRCENNLFLCIGEVIDITFGSEHVDELSVQYLSEPSVFVRYQVLDIVPATEEDDPELKHDWRWSRRRGVTHQVAGRLVLPINPPVCTHVTGEPFYLLESGVLMALGTTLLERKSTGENVPIPEMRRSERIPYREPGGKACFLVEDDSTERNLATDNICTTCHPEVPLPKSGPRILEHMAAHLYFDDPMIDRSTEPCGLCLRPAPLCVFYLKKGRGAGASEQVDLAKSTCPNKVSFSYAVAAESAPTSPCSNVPLRCPVCPATATAVWRYNLLHHMRNKHPTVSLRPYESMYMISNSEKVQLKQIWLNRKKSKVSRKRKGKQVELAISEAHSSRLALQSGNEPSSDEENREEEPLSHNDDFGEGSDDAEDEPAMSASEGDSNTGQIVSDNEDDPTKDVGAPSLRVSRSNSPASLPRLHPPTASLAMRLPLEQNPRPDVSPILSGGPENVEGDAVDDIESVFLLDGPETRVGRKRKTRDVNAMLSVCICGKTVSKEEQKARDLAIECKRVGCETGWYHLECVDLEYKFPGWVCSACETQKGTRARGMKKRRQ
ncbi:hypothetical protein FPV67DRAFT_1763516 [Lyophyllum atratum]|nr:hypothetical protein FPV67DRAFT_1763516 [Lyophyllum atratum]